AQWDHLLIRRGLAALARAEALGGPRGSYVLEASIAACHARAARPEDTDWSRIVALYSELATLDASPIIALNRAVAVAMASGAQPGLDLLDDLADEPALEGYHLLHAARGDLLARLGRFDEAQTEFSRAAELTNNERERTLLLGRAASSARSAV